MTTTHRRLIALLAAAVVFAVDQWVKLQVIGPWGVRAAAERAAAVSLENPGVEIGLSFFKLTFIPNYGVSLGMLTAQSAEMRYALVAFTSLIAIVVFVWMLREKTWPELFGLALVLGGALGNIRDRFTRGYVIDYADLHFGEFRPFMIFNIADAAITIGVLIILARSLFSREKPQSTATGPVADTAADAAPES